MGRRSIELAAVGLVAVGFVAAGCRAGDGDLDGGGVAGPEVVVCSASYRSAVTQPLDTEERLEITAGGTQEVAFDEVVLRFAYDTTEPGTASLRVDAALPGADGFLTRDLYQFADAAPGSFAGGHGFTGLRYVHPPESEAEVQFYCGASDEE